MRNRAKIEAVDQQRASAPSSSCEAEGSLAPLRVGLRAANATRARSTAPRWLKLSLTPESTALAKDLKRRGWRFVGPTTVYAFMQAMGLVNDHLDGCDAYATRGRGAGAFKRPGSRR